MKFGTEKIAPSTSWILIFVLIGVVATPSVDGQETEAVVRGKIVFDDNWSKSWDGNQLVVPFEEIETSLRERVTPPAPPIPAGFKDWTLEKRQEWEKNFVASDAGKKFLERRKQVFESAESFDVKFEKDGSFVIYDVPVGVYGIQGRVDKEIGGTNYGFEVFGQIEVVKGVDQLALQPLNIEITPMIQPQQPAPPFDVSTHDNKTNMQLDSFGDDFLFLNFWTMASPSASREQKLVQEMYDELKKKYGLRLLSINVDTDRKRSLDFIVENQLKGSHGFTDGLQHRMVFDYGVRSYPSFWLIGKDDNVMMTQFEIAQAMRVKPSITAIVADRIEGRDTPTPASDESVDEDTESKNDQNSDEQLP